MIQVRLIAGVRLPGRHAGRGRTLPRLGRAVIGLGLACAISASAFAASTVGIRLDGEIAPRCGFTGGGAPLVTVDVGDIARSGHQDHLFKLSCNAPFTYRIEARHGALTHDSASSGAPGYTASVPYEIAMHIPTDGNAIDDRCPGASLRTGAVPCAFGDSGTAIADDVEARLTVAWDAPAARLIGGGYADRLTLTLKVKY